jgi:hypothetical protein
LEKTASKLETIVGGSPPPFSGNPGVNGVSYRGLHTPHLPLAITWEFDYMSPW